MTSFFIKRISFFLAFLLVLGQFSCKQVYHISDMSDSRYRITEELEIEEDPEINKIIAPYKVELEKIMDEEIGFARTTMYKSRPESTLGNWLADLIQEESSKRYDGVVDFSVQNYGGIRVRALSEGPVTIGEIYEIMPFENQLVVMEARGVVVRTLFERIGDNGGWPVSNEIRLVSDDKGNIKKLKINGEDIDPTKIYHFALPDYVANGGDHCDFLINQKREELGVKIRDVIIEHLKNSKGDDAIISAKIQNRIIITKE